MSASSGRREGDGGVWSQEIKQQYHDFIRSKKQLSATSLNSYNWRLESLFKALASGTEFAGRVLNREDISRLLELKREEAELIVAQDDRQSHYRLLKEFLGLPAAPSIASMPSLLMSQSSHVAGSSTDLEVEPMMQPRFGASVSSSVVRGKVWDAELKRDYVAWLR